MRISKSWLAGEWVGRRRGDHRKARARCILVRGVVASLFALVLFASRTSFAQQAARPAVRSGIGVGAEATTTGIVGGTLVYDASVFHIDVLLGGRFDPDASTTAVAGRFFFPLHTSPSADFSIGPGIGVEHTTNHPRGAPDAPPPASTSANAVHLEGAVQIRAFIVQNVALSASAGIGAVFTNGNNSAVIGGQLGGALGITYFFF
jgi:hypothetical protein